MNHNNDEQEITSLTLEDVQRLQLSMRHFFVDYPPVEMKKVIWELYKGWVYQSAEGVSGDGITEMMLFYEAVNVQLDDVYLYCRYLESTSLVDILKSDHKI